MAQNWTSESLHVDVKRSSLRARARFTHQSYQIYPLKQNMKFKTKHCHRVPRFVANTRGKMVLITISYVPIMRVFVLARARALYTISIQNLPSRFHIFDQIFPRLVYLSIKSPNKSFKTISSPLSLLHFTLEPVAWKWDIFDVPNWICQFWVFFTLRIDTQSQIY